MAARREWKARNSRPSTPRRKYANNGWKRPLGIPTVKDRIVRTAVSLMLMRILEADFHPRSYGFRPQRQAQQAIKEVVQAVRSGCREIIDEGLSTYFATILHREANRVLRGWAGYIHHGNSVTVMKRLRGYSQNRFRRWLWRKHACRRNLWRDRTNEQLHTA